MSSLMIRPKPSKDLGNGVRPPAALGVKYPIWRLGALVSLPYSIGKVMMVQTPDRSLSLRHIASRTAGKTFPSSLLLKDRQQSAKLGKSLALSRTNTTQNQRTRLDKAISARPGYGSGPCRQGIARHVPSCPAALHLDCSGLRQDAPLRNCFVKNAFKPPNK